MYVKYSVLFSLLFYTTGRLLMEEKIKKFAEMVKESKKIVFFGGAGVSTESGLKDYRSRDGIYHTYNKYGIPPEEILSIDYFYENPETFYDFYREFFMSSAQPNKAHTAIAQLENMGKKVTVVTQNVDGLHQKAGSTRVLELHGSAAGYYCDLCGEKYSADYVADRTKAVPRCSRCGGIIRTEVVLYGENLDQNVMNEAVHAIWDADMLIIGGTSLTVYPAASFVEYFRGSHLVVINKEATRSDASAELVFHDSIGKVMTEMIDLLEK